MSQDTVFRIDAVIGGHSGGFKLAAREAARATQNLRSEVAKYGTAQAAANRENNKAKDTLAKQIVAQREAIRATRDAIKADIDAREATQVRNVATRALNQEVRRLAISERFREIASKRATDADIRAGAAAHSTASEIHHESLSALEAAVSLDRKGKATEETADKQTHLAEVAKIVQQELQNEAEAARHAAVSLALKGHESKKTARDQAELVVQAARARTAMEDERKKLNDLNFEFARHRGVLASNIRSQPLFAAMVASITAALGPLSSLLGDATAGVVAFGGALEPLLGNLVLIPSALSAAGQGLVGFGIAFHGVFKTLMAQGVTYQHDLAKLSKPAQDFVKILRGGEIGNAFKELQLQTQEGLFPGLVKGIKAALPLLKPLSQVLYDTSKAAGEMATQWGKFMGSKSFGHEFLAIGERNRQSLTRVGDALMYIVDATSKVLVAAGPFIGQFTQGIVNAADAIDKFVTKAKGNGDLREYFSMVWVRTKQWLSILGSGVEFFHNLFQAALPLTDTIMGAMVTGAKSAADWAKNSQPLKDFFISARAPLEALGRLVGALAKALATLAADNQGNLVLLADALSKHVVPALQAIGEFFAGLIPTISKVLGKIADDLKTILKHSTDLRDVLKLALKFIGGIADAAAAISKQFGGVGLVIVSAATLGALRTAIALMKTLMKLGRDKAFEQIGIDIIDGSNLSVKRGKGLGRLLPGGKSVEKSASKTVFNEVKRDAVDAGIGGGAATLVAGRAALSTAFRGASIRAFQIGAETVVRVPLIAAGAAAVDSIIEGMKRHSASEGAAAGLANVGHVLSMGMIPTFKDYGAMDKAGNKMLDTLEARVADIARRRKLSIPVDFDINKPDMPKKAFTDFVAQLESTVQTTKNKTQTWSSYFAELKTNVGMNMRRIATSTKAGSQDAKDATAANFNTAAAAVMKSMDQMGRTTKKGIETVDKYLRQALAVYGVSGRAATSYISTYIYRNQHPGSTGAGANEGGANLFKEEGGYVTAPGMRGKDNRHVVLGDGEAVLTSHHQKPVEIALRNTFGYGLHDLFEDKRPHYMAQGGFVAGRQWPMLSGDLDFLPSLGGRLEHLAEKAKTHIFVQSGRRTLAEQAALFAQYGPGRAAAPTANAPHVRGIAADITPGQAALGALAAQFGLGFPVPGEPWHIQLESAGANGPVAGTVNAINRLKVRMGGVPGALAQGAVDTVTGLANRILGGFGSGGAGGDGTAPGGITGKGHPSQNKGIARGLLGNYGWRGDQFPSLDKLWTRESGWDEFAVNHGSGAMGIPQALGHGNVFRLGDALAQIKWGLAYIKGRYGSPDSAWAHEVADGWYSSGGFVGAQASSRTPPPNVPISQAPSAPNPNSAPVRKWNPATKRFETHSKAEWEKIETAYRRKQGKKKALVPPTGKPPIGHRGKRTKTVPKKQGKHTKMFRDALKDVGSLQDLPNLVSGTEFERVAGVFTDDIGIAQKRWDLSDEQQIIAGLFETATGKQVPAMPSYDSNVFDIRDVLNWDGGIDAQSLNFVPGIHQHVDELNQNLGMEQDVVRYLNLAIAAYKKRLADATTYAAKYLAEMNELGNLVSFMKERRDSGQKQYDHEVRKSGTWQDRVGWNNDEISGLRKWLTDNADANTDQAKSYKVTARHRIQTLEDQNRHLRSQKPAPSKQGKDALDRISTYGNDLSGLTGKKNPDDPPDDVTKWTSGGIVGGVIKTFKSLTTTIGQTAAKINEINTDDNSGIPAHMFNEDLIRSEIKDWTGSHLAAQAISDTAPPGSTSDLADLLRAQLQDALKLNAVQSMQASVFAGLAPYIGRFQHGGWVPQTGMAMLERGEWVVPDPQGPNPMYNLPPNNQSPVHVTLVLDGHAGSLVKLVDSRINSKAPVIVSQTLGRKGRMITNAPGIP